MKKMMLILMLSMLLSLVGCSVAPDTQVGAGVVNPNTKLTSESDEKMLATSSSEEILVFEEAPEQEPVETIVEEVKLTAEEVAAAVIKGEYGNGPERIAKIEAMGYDYDEIQKLVNQLVPKETVKPAEYKANTIYIKKTAMPFLVSSYENQQADINGTSRTWVATGDYPNWSPDDNHGTFFAQHNNRGGDVIMKLNYGDVITVTDWNGTPYKYVVDKIIRNNMATDWDAELSGGLDKEYLIFQTCEYGDGNIHVFATRQYE